MYKKGHYGVSLLVFAPIGLALILLGQTSLAYLTGVVMLGLAMLPDSDHRVPGLSHRGVTHTLLFAILVGAIFGVAGFLLGSSVSPMGAIPLAAYGFFLGTVSILAHLLADLLTPMGVALFWPLSSKRYSLSLTPADSTLWNYLLFALGVFATAGALALSVRL